MSSEQSIFQCYKQNIIYKSIALHYEKYFINTSVSQDIALDLIKTSIDPSFSFKSSIDALSLVLNKEGIKKYRQQYRQYKYRYKNNFKQIQVRPETYEKIKSLSKGFGGIDDMLFEYAFDKSYTLDTSTIEHLPDALTNDERLIVLLKSNNLFAYEVIREALTTAYKQGFEEGHTLKRIRGKKQLKEVIECLKYYPSLELS